MSREILYTNILAKPVLIRIQVYCNLYRRHGLKDKGLCLVVRNCREMSRNPTRRAHKRARMRPCVDVARANGVVVRPSSSLAVKERAGRVRIGRESASSGDCTPNASMFILAGRRVVARAGARSLRTSAMDARGEALGSALRASAASGTVSAMNHNANGARAPANAAPGRPPTPRGTPPLPPPVMRTPAQTHNGHASSSGGTKPAMSGGIVPEDIDAVYHQMQHLGKPQHLLLSLNL